MYSKRHLIVTVPLALSLGAFTQGTFAVTNIDSCRTITSSGSFRLTRNLTANGACLVIQANNVTIDLQGHTLKGNGTGEGATTGDNTPRSGIEIRNGVVTNFSDGLRLPFVQGAVVERVRAVQNANNGILVGAGSVVSSNVANANHGRGIVTFNTGGIDDGGLITDNVAVGNGFNGILSLNNGTTIRGNSVRGNGSDGIEVQCPSAVIGNSVTGNGTRFGVNLRLTGGGCVNSQNATVD